MMGYGDGGFSLIVSIIWWIAVVVLLVLLVRWIMSHPAHRLTRESKEKNALEILAERYAKGEIGKEEFEAKKKDLTQ